MSSTSVLQPPSKQHNQHKNQLKNANNNTNFKRKNKHDRSGRKRSKSFSGCGIMMNQKPVLPTKFLLGGNINDPLNLNSLQDEEINRAMNAVTPKSSPIPTPPRRKGQIEVIIPANIHDPLNLIDCADDAEYEQQLCSPIKKCRKKRMKKRRTISATIDCTENEAGANSEAKTPETTEDSAKIPDEPQPCEVPTVDKPKELALVLSPKKDKTKRKSEDHHHHQPQHVKKFKFNMDKIVSPVVPQPGAWLKRMNSVNHKPKPRQNKAANEEMPLFKEKNKQFQYGNYNRYYGYRNQQKEEDERLRVFGSHSYLFAGKDILDIGCNIGHITLSVARDFGARTVCGIDIDPTLIGIARKNVKYYVQANSEGEPSPKRTDVADTLRTKTIVGGGSGQRNRNVTGGKGSSSFDDIHKGRGFPNNVTFKQCNYILDDDNLLALEQPQFDVILCLSITKWIHLNWGDNGMRQAFKRMYAQLKPGGKLILEPQNWASYKSKRKLTETIYKNYNSIEFFPEKFTEFLLSPAVGFAKSEILGRPQHPSKGFRRPIQVFTKSTMFPSERVEATPNNITPNNPIYNDSIYQRIMKTEKYESHTVHSEECIEHVYTNIINRYCGCTDDNIEANNSIGEALKKETECATSPEVNSQDSRDLPTEVKDNTESKVESPLDMDNVSGDKT